jgi:hypothetical protein
LDSCRYATAAPEQAWIAVATRMARISGTQLGGAAKRAADTTDTP